MKQNQDSVKFVKYVYWINCHSSSYLMKTINFIISDQFIYCIILDYVGIVSKRELNSLVGIV